MKVNPAWNTRAPLVCYPQRDQNLQPVPLLVLAAEPFKAKPPYYEL